MRPGTDARILSDLSLSELIETDYTKVSEDMVFRDFIDIIKQSEQNFFPVVDETQNYKGVILLSAIRKYALEPGMYDMVFLSQIMDTNVLTASLEDDLQDVLDSMELNNMDRISVVENDRFVGMIAKTRVLDLYRRELIMHTNIQ